jgi:hypothetical protein
MGGVFCVDNGLGKILALDSLSKKGCCGGEVVLLV